MTTVPDFATAAWFKARASESASGCFEVAFADGHVALRDSKNPALSPQIYPAEVWSSWLVNLRLGIFDDHRIELTFSEEGVQVRDGDDPAAQVHTFSHHEFRCFMSGVRHREFDLAA